MSENQSLPPASDSPLGNSTNNTNSAQEASLSDADPSTDVQANDWAVAPIPGTIDGAQLDGAQLSRAAVAPGREEELLGLIHDLNQCNDVLLSRVTQTESALEKSQAALKNEVANAQVATGKMAQQVSVEQASAQQISYNAQQQIAKLVSDLDNTEQALSRQLLINENLQTEVSNYQERISQLERECTIMAQQHLEEVQGRSQAEAASKDLRSRLQRQQRYTMQFKAALEKSLTVTTRPSDAAIAQPIAFKDAAGVVMPKAQRIMPWVSDNSSPFAGIDPHLESLIRGVGKSEDKADALSALAEPLHGSIAQRDATARNERSRRDIANRNANRDLLASSAPVSLENATRSDAEAKLWQDLERVISHPERRDGAEAIENTVDIP